MKKLWVSMMGALMGVGLAFAIAPQAAQACYTSAATCMFTCPSNCSNPNLDGGYFCDCSGACSPRTTCWAL